jgi:SMI1 / KNR4 family (SUKH-1)
MNSDTLERLDSHFRKFPILRAGPVPREEVGSAFAQFYFPLPDDYLAFVEAYGGGIVGPYPIYGLRRAAEMGSDETSALEITDHFIKQGWPGTKKWLIISMDHSGNPIGLAADGQIWISDHDHGQVATIAPTFESFLRKWCFNLPA